MKSILIWLSMIPIWTQAQSVQLFCFSDLTQLSSVMSKLREITTPKDQIEDYNDNCLQVSAPDHRVRVIEAFLGKNFFLKRSPLKLQSSTSKELCQSSLKFTWEKLSKRADLAISVGQESIIEWNGATFNIECLHLDKNKISYKIKHKKYEQIKELWPGKSQTIEFPSEPELKIVLSASKR